MSSLLAAALEYASRGWSILPLTGKRPALRSWARYQSGAASDATVRAWFRANGITGIGIVGGAVSGGVAVRDFDVSDSYHHWAAEHRALAANLPTAKTARGFHVYFRAPHELYRDLSDGELRGDSRHYTALPPSQHPGGAQYQWLRPLPAGPLPELDPVAEGLLPTGAEPKPQPELLADDLDALIAETLPHGPGQRNRAVFSFARALKGRAEYASADPHTLRPLVEQWHALALAVITTKEFDETWKDFLTAWPRVKCPACSGSVAAALERAKAAPVAGFNSRELALLAGICRELQTHAKDRPFFLSCRTAGQLCGVSHERGAQLLRELIRARVIEVARPAEVARRRAAEYRCVGGAR
jgi:hypothetical protein